MRSLSFILMLAYLLTPSCRSRLNDSDLKDEGLWTVKNKNLNELTSQIRTYYALNDVPFETLKATVKRVAESTFKIADITSGMGSKGTGTFVGRDGTFVTVAHVLFAPGPIRIETVEIDDTGRISTSIHDINVKEIKVKKSIFSWDLAVGKIGDFRPRMGLSVGDRKLNEGRRILNAGFPIAMKRDTPIGKDMRNKYEPFFEKELCVYSDFAKQKQTYAANSEDWKLVELVERVCRISTIARTKARLDPRSYDNPDVTGALTFASGVIRSPLDQNNYKFITDSDGAPGMSGGPMVDLVSGELMGLNDTIFGGTSTPSSISSDTQECSTERVYTGALIGQTVSRNIITEFLSPQFASDSEKLVQEKKQEVEMLVDLLVEFAKTKAEAENAKQSELEFEAIPEPKDCTNVMTKYLEFERIDEKVSEQYYRLQSNRVETGVDDKKRREKLRDYMNTIEWKKRDFVHLCYASVKREDIPLIREHYRKIIVSSAQPKVDKVFKIYEVYPVLSLPFVSITLDHILKSTEWISNNFQSMVVAYRVTKWSANIPEFVDVLKLVDTKTEQDCFMALSSNGKWDLKNMRACLGK